MGADRRSRRILVVDDHFVNRAVVQALLADIGYESEAAESGEQALSLLAERPFDAVLLDSEMPGLDGPEICRRLRRREGSGRRTPVIALTGHTGLDAREACHAAGMDGFLTKPLRPAELAAVLDRWTGIEATNGLEERLQALRELLGTEVIEAFLQQGEKNLSTMRRALREGDRAAFAEAAHALAGSAGLLGATRLAENAGELATLARQGDLGACAARLPGIESDYRDAAARMR